MNLKEQLHLENTRGNINYISDFIGENRRRFSELMRLFLANEYRVSQRASSVLEICVQRNPKLIKPYFSDLLALLKKNNLQASIKRNILRMFQYVTLPAFLHGEIIDLCFNFLTDRKEPIAIKVFSMTVLFNHTKEIPELRRELKIILEDIVPLGSAGIKARGTNILKQLAK